MIEEGEHFFLAEHNREFVGAADTREVLVGPGHFQSDEVKELDCGNILVDGFWRKLAFVEQVELILADGFEIEYFGALVKVPGEAGHVVDVVSLGFGREIA